MNRVNKPEKEEKESLGLSAADLIAEMSSPAHLPVVPPPRHPDSSSSPLGPLPMVSGPGAPLLPCLSLSGAHPALVSQYYQLMADKLWGPGAAGGGGGGGGAIVSPPGSDSGHQQHQADKGQQQAVAINGQGKICH